ncbi:vesicle-trafficking protein SEC22c isoform X1 [Cricetulus griseus]|uniref:Vesicle-trafficking protein SEC22c isoform X1 n=1 Tax=Cricetulus griseus TaxID=10029 RepID=A0A9J7FXZ0_CRIGR|nr:vesicle-trafficking protein SEC22c isoform X1 [Cricetulus griseus]XP_007639626.1 vesicle-trafficking protein SEC22c isoform X1 [Cricetulus griseus]XP_007639627.1 vesicle-trafficking protein SEC22c isoform X1 [Cricetulus griseus]XP_027271237.1 vesicle-trafficking protein SEC22c isoform X1 [Cricetulus griseus]XP_027271238.1 vesicle-trafficking protein SEC22c isoform X1 [Cricetulus griseus]XP_027271239.1 vesicle-trafficking protein SEC22c isoform X1 [Cricetulus griseus]XP_027271240.1 vesicle-
MPMILFASVVRVRDGLPLSASTDFYHAQEFLECRRQLKALARRLPQYPGRGSAESRDFNIYFSSSGGVACMAICSRQCPAAMVFCFLETLWWDFTASYDTTCIGLASRPYAFLEFDSVIQKTKWRFNHMSSSQMKSGLEKIQEELELQPPAMLSIEGTDVANGMLNGHTPVHSEPAPNLRMEPVTALGVLSLVLNILCAALNLVRGVHLAEHSLQVAQEEVGNILAFFIPSVACIVQSSQDSEGGADSGLHLPGQHVPARAEEHLASPLSHRSGFSVLVSDPDQTAAGEAVRLWSVRTASRSERSL